MNVDVVAPSALVLFQVNETTPVAFPSESVVPHGTIEYILEPFLTGWPAPVTPAPSPPCLYPSEVNVAL